MGDGGRTTKDRGLRCDQRALPFSCIPCISWFNSLRPLRSLRLQSRCPILKILLIQCKPSTRSTRPSSLSSIPSSSFGIVSTGLFAATILNHTLLLQSCNSSLNGPSAFAQDGNQSSYINPRIVSYCLFYCAIYSAIYSAIYRLMLLAQKGQTLPYMFYCICLPHIIFHRGNSPRSSLILPANNSITTIPPTTPSNPNSLFSAARRQFIRSHRPHAAPSQPQAFRFNSPLRIPFLHFQDSRYHTIIPSISTYVMLDIF